VTSEQSTDESTTPKPRPTKASAPAEEAPAPATVPGATRILVAEDEALIRLDLVEMLGEQGYEVVGQANNGQQAVELAKELSPDLVIMDVKMPVLDGLSAAEQLHETKACPVIMLTAFSQTELVERARDAGVMAYIVKPFTADDLRPAIDIATSRWQELKALEAEIADLGERLETRKLVDRAKGVLMTQLKLSESDAFRWIQKTAMDRRLGMKEVAEAVINGFPAS
jgi:response regulator NasT